MDNARSEMIELTDQELNEVAGGADFSFTSSGGFSITAQNGQAVTGSFSSVGGQFSVTGTTTP